MSWFKREEDIEYITVYDTTGDCLYGGRKILMTPASVSEYIGILNDRVVNKNRKIDELYNEIENNAAHNLEIAKLNDKIKYLESRLDSILKYERGKTDDNK